MNYDMEQPPFNTELKLQLAGWGSIGDREYPDELREAKLPVRSNRECIKNSPVLANLVRETTFCAGHRNGITNRK